MHAILDRDYFVASVVISPRSTPEVQALMRLCNEFSMPVWPYSTRRNTGYGGAAPRVPGNIALDLGRHIGRILEVNVEDAVERGVGYTSLDDALWFGGCAAERWAGADWNGCHAGFG